MPNPRCDYGRRMHRHVATRTLQLFAVMLFGLGLAACGSDGDGDGDAGSTTSAVSEGVDDTTTTVSEGDDGVDETSTTSLDETTTTTTEQDESLLIVSATGLVVTNANDGDSLTLDFGADRAEVIETVSSVLGAVPVESDGSAECPNAQARVATWPDLILDFDTTDRFLSWRLPVGSQLTDADGLGLGSARSDLGDTLLASVEESSLGTEFGTSSSVSGLLSGPEDSATVDVLWAGDLCTFR